MEDTFQKELEFVQCLANIEYLQWLIQQGYFQESEFRRYLRYLLYWKEPEYVKFIMFPDCLILLELLQEDEFVEMIRNEEGARNVASQIMLNWQYKRTPPSTSNQNDDNVEEEEEGDTPIRVYREDGGMVGGDSYHLNVSTMPFLPFHHLATLHTTTKRDDDNQS